MKHFRTEIIAQNIQFVAHTGSERFPPPWGEKRDSSENPGAQSDEAAVAQIAMGVVTHTPQRVLLQTEPQPADYADASAYTLAHDAWEEDCDVDGEVWTYRMLPLAAPGAGQERRSDTIGAL